MKLSSPKWLFIPICTPMYKWEFDKNSYTSLMNSVEENVDGFVPCLSSGEGHKMSTELWKQTLVTTLENTNKPTYVGIKRDSKDEVLELIKEAEELWATWVTTPVICKSESNIEEYVTELANSTKLPIIIYNTEEQNISDIEVLERLDLLENIVAIKDSSMNDEFFATMVSKKSLWDLQMSILQGMEHKLSTSLDWDGFLISLANVEPVLCKAYLETWNQSLEQRIDELFWKYNLWWEWYISLKSILMSKWIIESAEEINPYVQP